VSTRRTVTIVFADVSGWTALGERLDPESLERVMQDYFTAARTVLERHGGTVEKFIGDAVMAVFGIPELHEDDAVRAVRAALEIRNALAELNDELDRSWGIRLGIRIGVNTGEVVARDPSAGESFAVGQPVNVAQRLEEAAAPDEVLIGEPTFRLVADAVVAEPVGPLVLKGSTEPVPAYRVIEVSRGIGPEALESQIVGRGRELTLLKLMLADVSERRSSFLCTVAGPAGIGKSRLAREFVVNSREDATVAVGRCRPYGEAVAYAPLREIVGQLAGGHPREWIKSRLAGDPSAIAVAERIATAVAGGDIAAHPQETCWAFRKLFEAVADERPLVLVLEDAHWAEDPVLDVVEHVVGLSAGAPLLVLCLARPDLFDRRTAWGAPSEGRTIVSLSPLGNDDAEVLVGHLARAQSLNDDARARAVSVAEGNPLFLEQLVVFEAEGGGGAMPPTVRALLAARVERLPHSERAVLQRGAIQGRSFQRGAIAELLLPSERPELDERLLALVRKDFIFPRRGPGDERDLFVFRHALVRDAAYEALPKQTRAELHERFADWLEVEGGEDETVGYHLEQAARYSAEVAPRQERRPDLAARAAERLGEAGRGALHRGGVRSAATLLARAAELLASDEASRVRLLPDLAEALASVGELSHAAEVLEDARERAADTGDVHAMWRARLQSQWLRFQIDPAMVTADVLSDAQATVVEFERLGDDRALAHAWHLIAWVHLTYGRVSALAEAVGRGREHARAAGDAMTDEDPSVMALLALPTGPASAREAIAQAEVELERARTAGGRRIESAALLVLAIFSAFEERFDEARQQLAESAAIDEELGGGRSSGFHYTPAGMIELLAGDVSGAERELRHGYETLRDRGDAWFMCGVAAELADVLWLQGRDDEALELTLVSERAVGKEVLVAQMMWRGARAKVLARQGRQREAVALAHEAVEIIERTDYVLYQADALADLAQVLRLADSSAEAASSAERAQRLYEQKGNVAAARNLQPMLDALRLAASL
jgi:class 3 adenylate cyclase/tetratricopeptide (TPR) repeat protein